MVDSLHSYNLQLVNVREGFEIYEIELTEIKLRVIRVTVNCKGGIQRMTLLTSYFDWRIFVAELSHECCHLIYKA